MKFFTVNTQNRRDILLIFVLLLFVGAIFVYFNLFMYGKPAAFAYVYYGNSNDPVVTIDFVNETIDYRTQEVPDPYPNIYPIIDLENQTITMLGDYEIDDERQLVVIEYNFEKRSVQIIQEESPNHICSVEGLSTGKPLICLPNRIRVEFESSNDENEPDFTV